MKKFGLGLLKATFIYGGAIGGALLAQIILNKVGGTKIEPLEEGQSENEDATDVDFQDETEA